jgi:hypothetical protein
MQLDAVNTLVQRHTLQLQAFLTWRARDLTAKNTMAALASRPNLRDLTPSMPFLSMPWTMTSYSTFPRPTSACGTAIETVDPSYAICKHAVMLDGAVRCSSTTAQVCTK